MRKLGEGLLLGMGIWLARPLVDWLLSMLARVAVR
jgi:hypothetical protein